MSTFDKMSDYSSSEEGHEVHMDEDGSVTENMLEIDEETQCKFLESFETIKNFITSCVKNMGNSIHMYYLRDLLPL